MVMFYLCQEGLKRSICVILKGYVEDVGEGTKGETMEGSQVSEAIEKAMSSFWLFLRSDNKRCRGILKKLKLSDCQVEDPKDLQLFTSLSKEAHKVRRTLLILLSLSASFPHTHTHTNHLPIYGKGYSVIISHSQYVLTL